MEDKFITNEVAFVAHSYAIKVLRKLLVAEMDFVDRSKVVAALEKELVWQYCLMQMDKSDTVLLDLLPSDGAMSE